MQVWMLSVGLVSCLLGQATSPPKGSVAPGGPVAKAEVKYISEQNLGRGVTIARLSSGLVVLIQENHAAPVATVRCFVKNTGSAFEGKYLGMGISHVLEHLVAGGSNTKRSEDQIRAIVDSLGGQTNAYTSNDVTVYFIDCPAKSTDIAIELISDSMQHVTFQEAEYRREMGVVQRELEMGEADRSRVLYQAMKSLLYTTHPMRHPTIGYLQVLQSIKREDVVDFYKDRYVPQNMVFVVAGDVDTKHVLAEVLKNFKSFERTTEREVVLANEPPQASPRSTRIEMEGETTHVSVNWPTVSLQDPDLYPLDVASYLLTSGDTSRLVRRLRIDEPLVISVDSSSYTPGFVTGWFDVTAECQPENAEKVRAIILEEIEKLKTSEITDAELAKTKRQVAAQHIFSQQTVEAQARMLADSYLSTGDPLFDEHYVKGIQQVTADQIRDAAQRYLVASRLNSATIVPLGSKAEQVAKSKEESFESDVLRKQLSNGLTVLVKRHSVVPMVVIQAYTKAGSAADTKEKAGLASLATSLMEKGTKKYSAEQIAEFFDTIGGSFSLASQRNSSFLQCSILKEDLSATLDYVHQTLFAPTFPADEFDKAKSIRLATIAARRANPQTEIMDFWTAKLPDESPFSRNILGTAKTVGTLTVDDCRKFHSTYFVPNNMVLAIYGDIDPQATFQQIEKQFGSVPKAEEFEWPTFSAAGQLSKDVVAHLQNQKPNTAMVLIAFPTVDIFDTKTRSALEVFDAVITGGGGAGGRLHEELRGQQLVYYVFGIQMTGFAPGYFAFLAQTRPDSLPEVTHRIRANIQKIQTEGVPKEEFAKAKQKLLAGHAMQNTTPSEQAFEASVFELYGLGYDFDKGYEERINKVTVDEVVAVAKRYFEHGYVITSGPVPQAPAANGAGKKANK